MSKDTGNKYKFDFYLDDLNILIEYDGQHHHKPVEHWGGEEYFIKIQGKDILKNQYCEKNGIKLLRIRYNENIEEKLTKEGLI